MEVSHARHVGDRFQRPDLVDEEEPYHVEAYRNSAPQVMQRFGDSSMGNNARVHMGDVNNHYYSIPQKPIDAYSLLLESLAFQEMDARLHDVAYALPGTSQWLFKHAHFLNWMSGTRTQANDGFLYLKGKPGSGKSTVMKEALSWAEEQHPPRLTLFYFFNARSPEQLAKSGVGCYQSLLHQLLQANPQTHQLFLRRCIRKVNDGRVSGWTETELQNILIEVLRIKSRSCPIMFIDALDEGEEDDIRRMIKFLKILAAHSPVRICLSSRHYPNIDVGPSPTLVLENEGAHIADIEMYVQTQLDGENGCLMNELRSEICNRSAGIFLWVVLVVPLLNKACDKGRSRTSILQELHKIPLDLHHLFDSILHKDHDDFFECVALLEWVLYAKRPLTPAELYHAVRYARSLGKVDKDVTSIQINRYLLHCSRGLVEIAQGHEPFVRFIHETVRDFLLSKDKPRNPRSTELAPIFENDGCHRGLSKDCLSYLLEYCPKKSDGISTQLQEHALAHYAAEHWWQHIAKISQISDKTLLKFVLRLLTDKAKLETWLHIYDPEKGRRYLGIAIVRKFSPLYYTACVGLSEIVDSILEQGYDVNACDKYSNTALQVASFHGHETTVQTLLKHNAAVNGSGENYGTALQAASAAGSTRIAKLLIERGAAVNDPGRDDIGSALQVAITRQDAKMMELLFDHGADVNVLGGPFGGALQTASRNGDERIVRSLLRCGANVNAQLNGQRSAFHLAAIFSHRTVMKILLQYGADIDLPSEEGTALYEAVSTGNEMLVEFLLEYGANPNVENPRRSPGPALSALAVARRSQNWVMEHILCHYGAKEASNRGQVTTKNQL